ncbi:MAG: glycosyltransferase family 4 protein [Bdellovibrionales bacterium]|nr:glycosyltransferase family 4 protein [Bdellovibrionales bacterium]NQZ19400.1 glycosyltransferase family 4 protein [Bdellovibrionales bacterium]
MTNILYVCPSTGIGGAETFLKHSFDHHNSDEFKVHYLLFRQGPLYDFLQKKGASVYLTSHQPRLSKWSDQVMVRKKIRDVINEQKIDIVHSTMAYGALFSSWATKQMKVKHIWFQHGPASGWMDRVASILPHNGLAVNSHYTSDRQRSLENPLRFFIPRETPIEKILLGTDIERPDDSTVESFKNETLHKFNIDAQKTIISMLCRIQNWKGLHIFLEAIEQLKDLHPQIHGVIWGEAFGGSEYFDSLQNTIKQKNLPVTLAGPTDDASKALSMADILVNASIQPEPFGLSIIEAMMVGTVPIAPKEGGPLEIISNGKDGMLFKPRQSGDLAQKIKTLINDKELLKKLSSEAQQSALNKFQAQRAIQHLEQFYNKVLQA